MGLVYLTKIVNKLFSKHFFLHWRFGPKRVKFHTGHFSSKSCVISEEVFNVDLVIMAEVSLVFWTRKFLRNMFKQITSLSVQSQMGLGQKESTCASSAVCSAVCHSNCAHQTKPCTTKGASRVPRPNTAVQSTLSFSQLPHLKIL